MALSPRSREPPPILPSIITLHSYRYRGRHDITFDKSPEIPIPRLELQYEVSPPLPPLLILPSCDSPRRSHDLRMVQQEYSYASASIECGCGSVAFRTDGCPHVGWRDTRDPTGDEKYPSSALTERSRDSLRRDIGVRNSPFHFQTAADIHMDHILEKLGPVRNRETPLQRSFPTHSVNDLSRRLPDLSNSMAQGPNHDEQMKLQSPGYYSGSLFYSVASQRYTPFNQWPREPGSHHPSSDLDHPLMSRLTGDNGDNATSTRGSYDLIGLKVREMDATAPINKLHIDDTYLSADQERQDGYPAEEDIVLHCVSGQIDIVRQKDIGSRGSPTPQLATLSGGSSNVTTSAAAMHLNCQLLAASMRPASGESCSHCSTGGTSPGGNSRSLSSSPCTRPESLMHSSRAFRPGEGDAQAKVPSGMNRRKEASAQGPHSARPRPHMCECCPKKPKMFETAEELLAHESQKHYGCSFCASRFKNKNEAERHLSSVHVRRRSWSCFALSGYERAFHFSSYRPGEADSCGFCGNEFPRSGRAFDSGCDRGSISPMHATEQDWKQRLRHLQDVHKFKKCKSTKEFYRADHFRQHLKRTHAGTIGIWTNMLETACRIQEDPSSK